MKLIKNRNPNKNQNINQTNNLYVKNIPKSYS